MNLTTVKTKVVGVDISYDVTTYAIVDVRGNIIAEDRFPTTDYPDVNAFVAKLCESIVELTEAHVGYEAIRSIGISAPSANYKSGCIEHSPNMPWKGVIPLAAMLRDRMGIAVIVANNAFAVALGEYTYGSAHGMNVFVLVTLGHGMGSCLFINGTAFRGVSGYAGEVGHTCYEPGGRLCGCGKRGCLETYTAAKGIVTTAKEVMAESSQPSLMRGARELTPKLITDFCEQGDALAIETYRRTGKALGLGLANYASIVNPEAFVLAGGVANAGSWLLEPTFKAFEEHVFHNVQGKVKFLVSSLDDHERDVLGASALAWTVEEYSLFK